MYNIVKSLIFYKQLTYGEKKKKVSSPKSKRNVAEYRFQYEKVS